MKEGDKSLRPRSRMNSFAYAFQGWKALIKSEPNAKIHLAAAIAVTIAGFVRHLTTAKWITVVFAIALVWITEALNTCIELLCDQFCKGEFHPTVKVVKDIAAGAVLIASIAAVIIACIVFLG